MQAGGEIFPRGSESAPMSSPVEKKSSAMHIKCISCSNIIPGDDIVKGTAPQVNLELMLDIPGIPKMQHICFCGATCRKKFEGAKRKREPQLIVIKKIMNSRVVSKLLGSDIRVGTMVDVIQDFSPGNYVPGGQGQVTGLRVNAINGCAEFQVTCISGVYWLLSNGISVPKKQNSSSRRHSTGNSCFSSDIDPALLLRRAHSRENRLRDEAAASEQKATADAMDLAENERKIVSTLSEKTKGLAAELAEHQTKSQACVNTLGEELAHSHLELEAIDDKLGRLRGEISKLQAQNSELMAVNETQKHALQIAESKSEAATRHVNDLTHHNNRYRRQVAGLKKEISESQDMCRKQHELCRELEKRNEELRLCSIESLWLPGVAIEEQGAPFDNSTRFLAMELLSKGVSPKAGSGVMAAVLEMVFRKSLHREWLLKSMRLPAMSFWKNLRNNGLSIMNKAVGGLNLDSGEVNTWGSDASPLHGIEVLATAGQVKLKDSEGFSFHEDWVWAFNVLPDQTSLTEASAIKAVFDRMRWVVASTARELEVKRALDAVDAARLPYRDIKPENIMLTPLPEKENVGIHRLGGAVAQSDGAPGALKTKVDVGTHIVNETKEILGPEGWDVSVTTSVSKFLCCNFMMLHERPFV
jgi:hypothetical protein